MILIIKAAEILKYFAASIFIFFTLRSTALPPETLVNSIVILFSCFISFQIYYSKDLEVNAEKFLGYSVVFFSTLILIAFYKTPLYLNGLGGDASLHLAIVTKISNGMFWADPTYKKINNFYPNFYHYFSAFFSIFVSNKIVGLKLAAAFIYFVSSFCGYHLWYQLLGNKLKASLIIIIFTLYYPIHYKPFEFVSLLLFIPWWLFYIEEKRIILTKKQFLSASIIGGLIFGIYYYWFIPLILFQFFNILKVGRQLDFNFLKRFIFLGILVALFASPYLGPYLVSLLYSNGQINSLNNRWLKPEHLSVMQYFQFNWRIIFFVLTVLTLTFLKHTKEVEWIKKLFFFTFLYTCFGSVLLLIKIPLLHMRVYHVIEISIVFSSVCFILSSLFKKELLKYILIVLIILGASEYSRVLISGPLYSKAYSDKVKFKSYSSIIDKKELFGKVVLTSRNELNSLIPVFVFINFNAHFSNPASRFKERISFLSALSKEKNPNNFCKKLSYNNFDKIDYLFFPEGQQMVILDDNFPNLSPHLKRTFIFELDFNNLPCLSGDNYIKGLYRVL